MTKLLNGKVQKVEEYLLCTFLGLSANGVTFHHDPCVCYYSLVLWLVYSAYLSACLHFVFPYHGCQVTPHPIPFVTLLQFHALPRILRRFFQPYSTMALFCLNA
jgi:hypothetical protein